MKEAYLYKKLKDKKVKCLNCAHYCLLSENQTGICGVRKNIDGKLYALNYGKVIALNTDPIEKKPLFHFMPGTFSLSIASPGCNFRCLNCQNWEISQAPRLFKKIEGTDMKPHEIVEIAKQNNIPSISYTYTEPTIFLDFAYDIAKSAKKEGIKNIWVSNGFLSKESLDFISPYLDAANIDLKGFSEEFYQKYTGGRLTPVLETLKRIKEKKIWLEVTTLVVPSLNDSDKTLHSIAKFIKEKLGSETPWHVTQFSPLLSWKLKSIPETPIETLKRTWKIGKEIGLKYVYTGNIPGLETENTSCPKCGALVIKRVGYSIKRFDKNGYCPKCGEKIDIIE